MLLVVQKILRTLHARHYFMHQLLNFIFSKYIFWRQKKKNSNNKHYFKASQHISSSGCYFLLWHVFIWSLFYATMQTSEYYTFANQMSALSALLFNLKTQQHFALELSLNLSGVRTIDQLEIAKKNQKIISHWRKSSRP